MRRLIDNDKPIRISHTKYDSPFSQSYKKRPFPTSFNHQQHSLSLSFSFSTHKTTNKPILYIPKSLLDMAPQAELLLGPGGLKKIAQHLPSLSSVASKLKWLVANAPGATTLAMMALPGHDLVAEIRKRVRAIQEHPALADTPGQDQDVGFMPQGIYGLTHAILAHSKLTRAELLAKLEGPEVTAGGTIYYVVQVPRINTGSQAGKPRGFHIEPFVFPTNEADGSPFSLSSASGLNARGEYQEVKARVYGTEIFPGREPEGPLARANAGETLNPVLGAPNALNAEWWKDYKRTFAEKMREFTRDPSQTAYHTQGAIRAELSKEQLRRLIGLREFLMESRDGGHMASFGAHIGPNSCVHFARLLLEDFTVPLEACDNSLEKVVEDLIRLGAEFWWTDDLNLSAIEALNDNGTVRARFPQVDREAFQQKVTEIFSAGPMHASNAPTRASFAAQYNDFRKIPADADGVYEMLLEAVLEYLDEKLAGLGAV